MKGPLDVKGPQDWEHDSTEEARRKDPVMRETVRGWTSPCVDCALVAALPGRGGGSCRTETLRQLLAPLAARSFAGLRCSGCTRLDPSANPDGATCRLRTCAVQQPSDSACADHSDLAPSSRMAIGPVYEIRADELRAATPAPDSPKHRNALIQVLEDAKVGDGSTLDLRARIAVEQALASREGRYQVHLARIEMRLQPRSQASRSAAQPLGVVHEIVGDAVKPGEQPLYLLNFTWQGRALHFGSLTLGIGLTVAILLAADSGAGPSGRIVVLVPLGLGTPLGGVLALAGIRLFRRFGIPFRATDPPRKT